MVYHTVYQLSIDGYIRLRCVSFVSLFMVLSDAEMEQLTTNMCITKSIGVRG